MMRLVWLIIGLIAVALGTIGLFLPFLPTVPFLLLAAFAFGRSSARLHRWLMSHPTFGPMVRDWNERGAISRKAKYLATASILLALFLSLLMGFGLTVILVQAVTLSAVTLFIWTRPD